MQTVLVASVIKIQKQTSVLAALHLNFADNPQTIHTATERVAG
jgi:hypothetical protein